MKDCNYNGCIWCPCCRCRPPIIIRCPTGPTGATGEDGATGATGPTAPSIYAQHGNCRNHAAFHYLKDN